MSRWRAICWSAVMLPLALGACAQISDEFAPPDSPTRLSDTAEAIESEDEAFPNLASVPDQRPEVTTPDLRATIKEGLVADRANAEYTDEVLRPGGATAHLEETPAPRAYSIVTGPSSDITASVAQNPASPSPASPEPAPPTLSANLPAASPEPAPDALAADIAPPPPALEPAPLPEMSDVPPSPAAELLGPVDPAPPAPTPDMTAEVSPAVPPVGERSTDGAAVEGSGEESTEESDLGSQLAEPEAEIAALPPGGAADSGTQILFGEGSADLSTTAQSELAALADQLLQDKDARVQLLAYASGDQETSSQARRLSLSRAVAVRRFLIDQGVSSARMDVRALGNQVEEAPADRVDILVADR